MKTSNYLILSTFPLSQPVKKPCGTVSLTRRQRLLYGRKRRYPTGKERDNETGLYYYGARYLDSRTGRWLSGDPAMGEYVPSAPVDDEARKRNGNLPGMGGVFNYVNLHAYHYAGNNPVKYTDPDGAKEKPAITGISGVLPLAGEVDTGNRVADSLIAGLGNVWNVAASAVNAPIRYAGDLINAADDMIPDELTLTGRGLKEDIFVTGLFSGMNPGVVAGAVNGGKAFAAGLNLSKRDALLTSVTDSHLKKIVDQLYRPGATTGDGGTADMIRHELKTGKLSSPSGHSIKGIGRLNELNKLLESGSLNKRDTEIATKLAKDLSDALGGH